MGSLERTPSDHGRMWRRFAALVVSAALLLPTQMVWLAPPAAAATCPTGTTGVGSGRCQVVFNASSTWTVPTGVSLLDVVLVGGGGGGGGNQDPRSSLPGSGGGGGGGQVVHATNQPVTEGASATITVGAGGIGGPNGPGNGTSGGISSFVTTGVDVSASGGSPGGGGSWGEHYPSGSGYGGTSGAGYAGGVPDLTVGGSPTRWSTHMGGGGGGSSARGGSGTDFKAGDGGAGTVPSGGLFAGYTTAYAGGGGGGSASVGGYTTAPGQGAAGGGAGNGSTTSPGNAAGANTGGGGGGTGSFTSGTGGPGGSGLVIVRFLAPGAAKLNQTISFTSTAPTTAVVGGSTYVPTASASSGLPVDFTIASTASSVCSISEGVVSFTAVGTCRIDANQAGNTNWNAATQVYQSSAVGKGSQTVTLTSTAPTNAAVGGTYTVTATGGGSGNAVTFSSATTSVCTVSGSTVSFIAAGTCTIDANQAGNTNWNAAPQVQQSFGVAVVPLDQTIYFNTSAPTYATVGGTYAVYSTADSELPVTLTIDSTARLVCSLAGSSPSWTVSFIGIGTCTINANQAGGINKYGKTYNPAPQVQQSFAVHAAGPWTCPAGTLSVGGGICEARFDASSTWTIPAGVRSVDVLVVGGGGGAGGGKSGNCAGGGASGGGGGGQVIETTNRAVTPGASVTVTVGAGGAGSAYQGPYGTSGGTSSFVTTGVTLRAAGGLYGNEGCAGSSLAYNAGEGGASGRYGYAFGGNEGGQPYILTTVIHDPERPPRTTYRTQAGGGGGGSSAAGANGISSAGGAGGAGTVPTSGLLAAITTAFGGGGGGGATSGTPGAGAGGGGNGVGQSATPNTGGGGGGTGNSISGAGGAGGSGIVIVRFSNQSITFTSTAPSSAVVGGSAYTVTATATSGQAVSLAVDSSATSVCSLSGSISGSTVSFIGVGTCKIDATQAGGGNWGPAVPAQQSFAVGKGSQTIQFTSTVPGAATIGGSYTPTATGGASGNPVAFSIDATASTVCSISGGVVSITANGVCTIDADQAGNANYNAAPQAQQSFGVGLMNVTTTADELTTNGNCSLREAIRAANTDTAVDGCAAGNGADVIFVPAGTYNLAIAGAGENAALTGDLDITDDLTISGSAAATTILDGADLDRVFHVLSGTTVTTKGLTVRNGTVSDKGGGIFNAGTLAVVGSTITGNTAGGYGYGGGFANESGASLTITGSTISNNTAINPGGGLWNNGTATVRTSTVSGNTTTYGAGGGLYTEASLTVTDSTVSGNSATSGSGGGIGAYAGSSVLLERSTVSANHATGSSANGGGIYVAQFVTGTLTIVNSTLSGNSSSGFGGGLATYTGWKASLTGTTITGNTAAASGYGHGVYQYQGAVSAKGTLIYGNGTGNADCATGHLTSTGANLGSSSCFGGALDTTSADPLLGPLADNGGPTFTHEPLAGSPAIGAASACDTATDQRGISRPQGSKCDIGSFEVVDTTHALTTTTLDCSPASIPLGQGTLCTATVESSSASVPTGTVTFTGTANGSFPSPATCTLTGDDSDSGSCSLTYIPGAVGSGTHTLGASYGGDDTHAASADADGFAVQVAARANVPPTISAIGDQSTNEGTSTGPIAFTIGDVDSDVGSLVVTGISSNATLVPDTGISLAGSGASRTVTISPATGLWGVATITVRVSDGADETSTSFQLTVTEVSKATQTIEFTSTAPGNAVYGGSYTVTATGGGSGNPVTFSIASASSAVCSISGSTVSFIGVGLCAIDADQAGDDDYLAAVQAHQSFAVGKATPTISISNLPVSGTYGGGFTATYTYSGDGTTSVTSSTTSVCTVAAGVVSYVGHGTCTLIGHATATTLYAAATGADQSVQVGKASLTITASSPTGIVYGDPVPTISPSYAGWVGSDGLSVLTTPPSCTTTYKQGDVPAGYPTSCTGAAADNYTVAYVAGLLTVGAATPTISISNLPASGTYGGTFTPTFAYPGDGTTSVSSSTPDVCTVAAGVVSYVAVGTCTLLAHATATNKYAAVTGANQSFQVSTASPTITISNIPSSAKYGETFTPTFTYSGDGTTSVSSSTGGTCIVSAGGVVSFVAVGTCTLIAQATATTNNAAATGTAQDFSVGKASLTITASSPTDVVYGDPVPTISPTYAGWVGSDGPSVLTTAPSCTTTYKQGDVPGDYPTSCSGAAADNYSIAYVSGLLSVGRATPSISISNLPGSGTYGGGFTPTFTYNGDGTTSVSSSTTSVCTVAGGAVSYVGVGTCTLVAHATATTKYAAVTGAHQSFAVGQASQAITVTKHAPSSAAYKATFSVAATASSGLGVVITTYGACGVATGGIGTATIVMTDSTGTCAVAYDQPGNANFDAAPGVWESVTATTASQKVTVTKSAPATAPYKGTFNVTATASSGLAVSIAVSGVCTATSPMPGEAQVTMTRGTGICTVVFDQPGNAYYQPATQVIQKVSATKASQMITVQTAPPATAVYKSSFTVSATASSNLNVKITTSGVCTGTGYGTATVSMTSGTGKCTVFFDQGGNDNYAAAKQVGRTVTAQRLAQVITFDPPSSPQTYGVTFHVSPATDAPLAVSLAVGSGSVCSIAASPGGGWDVTMTSGTGSCALTASQAGTTNYLPADDVSRTVVAQKAAASIAIGNLPASGTYGASFTPSFTYGGDGTTSVASSTTAVCTVDGGVVSYVGVGTCALVAKAAATANYEAATGTSQSFDVVKAIQTIDFTSTAPAKPVYGGSYTVTATGGGSGNPVTFSIASASSAVCSISGSTVSFIGVGNCRFEANQAGNDNYLAAPQAEQSFAVERASLTVTANDQTVQYGDPLPVLTVEYDGFVGSETPSVLDGTLGCATTATVTGGKVMGPADAYPITCSGLTSPHYALEYVPGTLTVTREDTVLRLAQNNPHAVQVITLGGNKGKAPAMTFVLRITEVSDSSYGDIFKASPVTVTLTPVGAGNGTTCTVPGSGKVVQIQSATATSPGFVVVSCTVPAGTVGINVYEVVATVGGSHYQGSDRSVLTVYDPLAGGANGAGTITNPNSGNAADIAFSAGYLKNGRQVQGKFLYVSRDADGNVVHVLKGNVMSTLAIDATTALVTGKATLDGVGNYTYVITAVDNRTTDVPNPASNPDNYGQQLTDASGAIVTSLTFDPVVIGTNGNIFVGK